MRAASAGMSGGFLALVFGAGLGWFFLKTLPLADGQPVFLLAVPFACALLLGLVLNPAAVTALLILTRCLLDPVLDLTKGDAGLGFGALLNLFVIVMTVWLALQKIPPIAKSSYFKSWAVFLLVCAAAVLVSPSFMKGAKVLFNLLSYFSMAMLPSLIHPERNDKRTWIKLLLASTVLPTAFAAVDWARGGHFYEDAGSRVQGTFSHPNILAFYFVWVLALLFTVRKSGMFRLTGFQRFGLGVYFWLVAALLVTTKTRNAMMSLWLFYFFYGCLKERKYAVLCLAAAAGVVVAPHLAPRLTDVFSHSSHRLNSFEWRIQVWSQSLASVRERWLLGHGLGTFRELSRTFLIQERGGVDAHNVYLQLAFETGIVGLAAYLAVFYRMMRAVHLRYKRSFGGFSAEHAAVLAYTASYLISGFADNVLAYLALNWYCWFFWGVVLKAMHFQRYVVVDRAAVPRRVCIPA